MMKEMKGWAVFTLGLLVLAASTAGLVHAISCADAIGALVPCASFLVGSGEPAKPSAQCCEGAQNLNKMADTTEARRTICECFVQSAPSFGVNPERVEALPKLCHLSLTIPGRNVNCSNIQEVA